MRMRMRRRLLCSCFNRATSVAFLAEVHSDQAIYLSDPAPVVPERTGQGRAPNRRVSEVAPQVVSDWAAVHIPLIFPTNAWKNPMNQERRQATL